MRCVLIIVWFGCLPDYLPNWMKSVEYNSNFDFLIFTDVKDRLQLPENVSVKPLELGEFKRQIEKLLQLDVSLSKAYRICDFRPMYGKLFEEEIKGYDFWGYCDLDVIFGRISDFVTESILKKYDGILNCGSFTLYRNVDHMNNLYMQRGALFPYSYVASHNATFAFDETTGIKRIAKRNKLKVIYQIPYMETEIRHRQLRSRFEANNPDYQAFYWEKGELFRVKLEDGEISYQLLPYIHLQKRKIAACSLNEDSFWITPDGYKEKFYPGNPTKEDVIKYNPYPGIEHMKTEIKQYKRKKLMELLKKTPLQIVVRIRQEIAGINAEDGTVEEREWQRY